MVLHGWNKLKNPIVINTRQVGVIGIYINNTIVTTILVTQLLKSMGIINVPLFPITTIRTYLTDIEISIFEVVDYT
jgi:hypothetical protein